MDAAGKVCRGLSGASKLQGTLPWAVSQAHSGKRQTFCSVHNKSLTAVGRSLLRKLQGCRLPALKTPQTLPCSSQAAATQAAADLSCSSNKSLRPWQRPFKERSRLPFASPQNSPNPPLQLPGATQAAADLSCSSNKSLRPWQRPFYGRSRLTFASPQNSPKPSPAAPRRHSGRGRPFLQLQQVPEALAASFYGRSRLPFTSPQNSAKPCPCSSQAPLVRPRQTFPAAPTSP